MPCSPKLLQDVSLHKENLCLSILEMLPLHQKIPFVVLHPTAVDEKRMWKSRDLEANFSLFTQAEKLTKQVFFLKLLGLSNWTSLFYQGIESTLK